jgi:serine/threonine-protein kinase
VRPFRGETLAQIQRAVLEHRPPLANELAPSVPKPLAQITARAMATDPERRFPSAAAMARELRHWLEVPVAATPAPGPSRKPPGWRWQAAAGVGLALLLVAGASWFMLSRHVP